MLEVDYLWNIKTELYNDIQKKDIKYKCIYVNC